jgi:hypothetical protein
MRALITLVMILLFPTSMASCAVTGDGSSRVPMTVKMTPNHATEPTRIRFDVNSTPYVAVQDERLPMHEKIKLGMRQLATERLAAKGYCPHGFRGPELVLCKKALPDCFFFVDCLAAPAKSAEPITEAEPKAPPPK